MGTPSFVRVPPDSTGKRLHTQAHTIGGQEMHGAVHHLSDPMSPDNMQRIDERGAAFITFAEGQPTMAGYGSIKTAMERAIGVYESSLDTYASLFSEIMAVGGTSSYAPVESSQVLSVTGATGSRAMLITNRYHYYLPGSASLFKMTVACGDVGKANNVRRWGAFDSNDGVFFELSGTNLNVVIRNSTSGAIVETRVPQASWSHDVLDGTGLSGFDVDISKINVFWIDYQWLGAGRVRFGVYAADGSRVVCHQFQNAGSNALPYMRTGTLPATLENINTGAAGSASELRSVCIGVYTEGTYQDYAFWRFADVDRAMTGINVEAHAVSLRTLAQYNGKHNHVIVYPETLNVWCDAPVSLTIYQNTAVTGGSWDALASACEANTAGAVDTAGAQRFKTLYFPAGATSMDIDRFFEKNDEGIMTASNGVPEVWSFMVQNLTAAPTAATINIGYKELW